MLLPRKALALLLPPLTLRVPPVYGLHAGSCRHLSRPVGEIVEIVAGAIVDALK